MLPDIGTQFHEIDIAPNLTAKQRLDAFCRRAPEQAAHTGYPVLLARGD